MHNRLRMVRLTTALLYVGPLVAGLAGQGWSMVPIFAAVFILYSVILQPGSWPRSVADLGRPGAAVALAALIATQALLVVACFAFGRGLGGVLAFEPGSPVYLPVALSFAAVPLAQWMRRA